MILPYVLDSLREVRRPEMLEIARLFGFPTGDQNRAVREVPRLVRDLVGRLGIPTNLRAFGIAEADLERLNEDAIGVARLAKALPRPDINSAYRSMIRNAWQGRLSADASTQARPESGVHDNASS